MTSLLVPRFASRVESSLTLVAVTCALLQVVGACGPKKSDSNENSAPSGPAPVGTTWHITLSSGEKACIEKTGADGACKVTLSDTKGVFTTAEGTCVGKADFDQGGQSGYYWELTCEKAGAACFTGRTKIVVNGNSKTPLKVGETWLDNDTKKSVLQSTKPCSEWMGTAAPGAITCPAGQVPATQASLAETTDQALSLVDANATDTTCANQTAEDARVRCMARTYDIVATSSTGSKTCYSFETDTSGQSRMKLSSGTLMDLKQGALKLEFDMTPTSIADRKLKLTQVGSTVGITYSFKPKPDYSKRLWTAGSSTIAFETRGFCAAGLTEPAAAAPVTTGNAPGAAQTTTTTATSGTPATAESAGAPANPAPVNCMPASTTGDGQPSSTAATNGTASTTTGQTQVEVGQVGKLSGNFSGGFAVGYVKGAPLACADFRTSATSCEYRSASTSGAVTKRTGVECVVGAVEVNGVWRATMGYKNAPILEIVAVTLSGAPSASASTLVSATDPTSKIVKMATCPLN